MKSKSEDSSSESVNVIASESNLDNVINDVKETNV